MEEILGFFFEKCFLAIETRNRTHTQRQLPPVEVALLGFKVNFFALHPLISLIPIFSPQFLKGVLGDTWGRGHTLEINLPSVRLLHLKVGLSFVLNFDLQLPNDLGAECKCEWKSMTFALQRAVKFMYTGQLKMTKSEIDKDHLVWHVNHILLQLFRVDAKLNLPLHLLVPPASDDEDGGAGDGGGGGGFGSKREEGRRPSRTQRPSLPQGTYYGPSSEDKGRQNAQFRENTPKETMDVQKSFDKANVCNSATTKMDVDKDEGGEVKCEEELALRTEEEKERRLQEERADIERELREELDELRREGREQVEDKECGKDNIPTNDSGETDSRKEQRQSEAETPTGENRGESMDIDAPSSNEKSCLKVEDCEEDEVVELEQQRIPTPDIVDLLDSDDDEKEDEAGGSLEEEVDRKGVELPIPEAPRLLLRGREDSPSKRLRPDIVIPEAPRLIPREGSRSMAKKSTGGHLNSPIGKQNETELISNPPDSTDLASSTNREIQSSSGVPFPPPSSSSPLPLSSPAPPSPVMLARKHSGPRSRKRRRRGRGSLLVDSGVIPPPGTEDPSRGSSVDESGMIHPVPSSADESPTPDTLGQAMEIAGLPGSSQSGVISFPEPRDMPDFGNVFPTPSLNRSLDPSLGPTSLNVYRGRVGGRGSRGRSKPTKGVSVNIKTLKGATFHMLQCVNNPSS